MNKKPEQKLSEDQEEQPIPVSKSKRLSILLFGIFVVLMICFGVFMFIIIQSYYTFPNEDNVLDGVQSSGAFAKIKKQWQEHELPLDFDSFSEIINDMKRDIKEDKIPQLKDKLESLKKQIDDQKDKTAPELKKEWESLETKVDELMTDLKDKSQGLSEKIQNLQDDANELLEKEKEQLNDNITEEKDEVKATP